MRKTLFMIAAAIAALAGPGSAVAAPISALITLHATSDASECDLIGPAEQSRVTFSLSGRTGAFQSINPLSDRPFRLTGTGRIAATTVAESLDATLTIDGRDGDVVVRLRFPGEGVSHSAICRPWLDRLIFSVSDARYEATWPDGTRESGVYSFNYNRSSFGLTFGMTFLVEEILPPPPPPAPSPVTLHLPDDMTVEATGAAGAVVTFSAYGVQGDRVFAAACSPRTGSTFPFGTTTVECEAGTERDSFTVTVEDTTPPVLQTPSILTPSILSPDLEIGLVGYVYPYHASAVDVVDGDVEVTCDPPQGSEFAPGTTRVTCWATDSRGNRAERSFDAVMPSAVGAFDSILAALGLQPGTLPYLLLQPHLDAIRAGLEKLESEEYRAQTLRIVFEQLAIVRALVRANPFLTAVVDGRILRALERQASVVWMTAMRVARHLAQRIGGMLVCDSCSIASAHAAAVEAALAAGSLDVAAAELDLLERAITDLQATGALSQLAVLAVSSMTRQLGQHLAALQTAQP